MDWRAALGARANLLMGVTSNRVAINQWLQYRQVGRASYPFGEHAYITLSLVAKTLLAWQIFASALASTVAS